MNNNIVFIPKNISNTKLKILEHYPLNILLTKCELQNNEPMLCYAEYIPNLETFIDSKDRQSMFYRNKYDKQYSVRIVYYKNSNSYGCYKIGGAKMRNLFTAAFPAKILELLLAQNSNLEKINKKTSLKSNEKR